MSTTWHDFLAARGAHIDNGVLSDFGNPAAELDAARNATVLVPLTHLALIECAGEEATAFLHNQLTSDVNHLAEQAAQYTAWCTHKGRMQASFVLYRQAASFRALLSADLLDATLKRLKMFVLRAKVQLSDLSAEHAALGLAGPNARQALQAAGLPLPEEPLKTAGFAGGTVIQLEAQRFVIVATNAALPALFEALSKDAKPVGTPIWHWFDIQAGVVLITAATKEEFVPQMVNFDKIGGVSFHKGCYPGQEVVARTQYLGKLKRHLYRLRSETPIAAGTPLFQGESREQACGLIASASPAPGGGFAALAVIKESAAEAEETRLQIPGIVVTAIEPVIA